MKKMLQVLQQVWNSIVLLWLDMTMDCCKTSYYLGFGRIGLRQVRAYLRKLNAYLDRGGNVDPEMEWCRSFNAGYRVLKEIQKDHQQKVWEDLAHLYLNTMTRIEGMAKKNFLSKHIFHFVHMLSQCRHNSSIDGGAKSLEDLALRYSITIEPWQWIARADDTWLYVSNRYHTLEDDRDYYLWKFVGALRCYQHVKALTHILARCEQLMQEYPQHLTIIFSYLSALEHHPEWLLQKCAEEFRKEGYVNELLYCQERSQNGVGSPEDWAILARQYGSQGKGRSASMAYAIHDKLVVAARTTAKEDEQTVVPTE